MGTTLTRSACAAGEFRALVAIFLLTVLFADGARANPEPVFPAGPYLRIETGLHTGDIKRIDVDRAERYLITGSLDKTVRVWDLTDGTLLRTLRVPMGSGNLGMIYAVALSPDGRTIAAGGWTGPIAGTDVIYLLDRATGVIKHRITGLESETEHLAFSPDGRFLAALLSDQGLRVYETQRYRLVESDRYYDGNSDWADFDQNGRLVTSSDDFYIRLYDKDFKLILREEAPGGSEPFGVAFSPDGRRIAVGYMDRTRIDVLSADDLTLLYSPDTSDFWNGDLSTVAWSQDGEFLFASGDYKDQDRLSIIRWSDGGRGDYVEFPFSRDAVTGLKPLRDGRLAVGSLEPLLAVLDPDGRPIWNRWHQIADFRGQVGADSFRISEAGDVVQFNYGVRGERPG